ncbi:MAG TPA: DNA polymerase I [Dehalococcoidia bacterium]|nr:DNA polymerase I [Dehalococcoidia bacterium]
MNLPPDRPRRLAIFDGHGIIHRAYYALRENPLAVRRTGEQTSAVFGFTNTLLAVIDDLKPTHVAVALDLPGPTFRHQADVTYKATRFEGMKAQVVRSLESIEGLTDQARLEIADAVLAAQSRDEVRRGLLDAAARAGVPAEAMPGLERSLEPVQAAWDIARQIGRVIEMLEAFNIPVYAVQGYEADDVIGTLSVQAVEQGIDTYLVTLDTDFIQLVRPGVSLYMMRPYQRDIVLYDVAKAKERYKFDPPLMRDFKALRGDASDNIPGIPGVGDGTATKLLVQFGDIDAIYAHIDEVKPDKLRDLLKQFEGQVRRAREMATIRCDVPGVRLDLDACVLGRYDRNRVLELLRELEFRSLVPRLPPVIEDISRPKPASVEVSNYQTVRDEPALQRLVARIRETKGFAFNIEATAANPFHTHVAGISVATAPGEAAYIPVGHQVELGGTPQLPLQTVLDALGPLFADEGTEKTAHNGKFDLVLLADRGVPTRSYAFDTALAAYILGETVSLTGDRPGAGALSLKWLVSQRLGQEMKEITLLLGKSGSKQLGIDQVRIEDALEYCAADVDFTLRLREPLERELRDQGMWKLFHEIEMPLVPVLARMEEIGIACDVAVLRELGKGLNEQIRYLEEKAYAEVGRPFNLGSPQQLSQVLFEELKLPKTRRTKQGYSTDAQAIEALRGVHPIIDILLEWRELTKLRSTYIEALPAYVDPRDGRIHTTFSQAVATTGRLSSNNPNLQNIPVRSELGGQVRRAFVARDIGPNPLLISADYSQIELRIAAHLSGDRKLIDAFLADEDIHAATAAEVFGVPLESVTKLQRNRAKVFNFGVLYGLSEYGLATRERISREEANQFIKTYFEKYEAVKRWREELLAKVRRDGYAETLAGRRRYIPDIHSSNYNIRSAAERMAINMPIQGTASDIIKIAMNRVDREMQERGFKTRMLLQVHDELIFEGPRAEVDDMRELLLRIMPASFELAVPLKVDVKVGPNWADMA